jgi:hypothetical protein
LKQYRSVPLDPGQSEGRIKTVCAALDVVLDEIGDDHPALLAHAKSAANPPESRRLAATLISASWDIAAEDRRLRPTVTPRLAEAVVAGLVPEWMSPTHFCSDLDSAIFGEAVPREPSE